MCIEQHPRKSTLWHFFPGWPHMSLGIKGKLRCRLPRKTTLFSAKVLFNADFSRCGVKGAGHPDRSGAPPLDAAARRAAAVVALALLAGLISLLPDTGRNTGRGRCPHGTGARPPGAGAGAPGPRPSHGLPFPAGPRLRRAPPECHHKANYPGRSAAPPDRSTAVFPDRWSTYPEDHQRPGGPHRAPD